MANLAIKGHATRGKEVIEILEMFGGKNQNIVYSGKDTFHYYFIDNETGYIRTKLYTGDCWTKLTYNIFTLEEFLEKFPYKVGDQAFAFGNKCTIIDVVWDGGIDEVVYTIKLDTSKYTTTKLSKQLQPYKEETMKDYLVTEEDYVKTLEVEQKYIDAAERLINQLSDGTHWKCKDFDSQKMIALFLKKNTSIITEKEDSIIVDIPMGYEFAGIDDNSHQVVFDKIGCQYPKTYGECCDVLKIPNDERYIDI